MLLPPGISDRSYIRSDYIRSMPTPSRAIFLWRPYGSLLVVGPSFSFVLELPELDDKAELEGTFLMLSKYLAIFSSVVGKVFLGM